MPTYVFITEYASGSISITQTTTCEIVTSGTFGTSGTSGPSFLSKQIDLTVIQHTGTFVNYLEPQL